MCNIMINKSFLLLNIIFEISFQDFSSKEFINLWYERRSQKKYAEKLLDSYKIYRFN